MKTLAVVSVDTDTEVSRIVLSDDGAVTYSGGGSGKGVHQQAMRVGGLGAVEAFDLLAEQGWSNGKLRIVEAPLDDERAWWSAFERELSGADLADFNAKHPRGLGGKFAKKLAESIAEALGDMVDAGKAKPPRKPRAPKAKKTAKGLDEVHTEADLHALTVVQLRELAKLRGVKVPARASRAELVDALKPPPPKPTPLPTLTGRHHTWWLDRGDTEPDRPVPVRDLQIGEGRDGTPVVIRSGSLHRRGGVVVLVDHDGLSDMVSEDKVVREFFDQHREFETATSQAGKYQRGYAWVAQSNPDDAYFATSYGLPDMVSFATAGNGTTTVWGQRDPVFGPGGHRYILRHEFGHNVGRGVLAQSGLAQLHDGSVAWAAAARHDGAGYRLSSVDDYEAWGGLPKPELYPDPYRQFPDGVTDYGRSSQAEDFAESVMLYLNEQRIGNGRLAPGAPWTAIYFRDLFPARAALLDRIFPDVAVRQQNLRRSLTDARS